MIIVSLSEPLDPATAGKVGSYHLVAGRNIRKRGLVFDRALALQSASYIAGSTTVMLVPGRGVSLRQPIRLIIPQAAGLHDLAGNLLDGNRDGQPGGDFITRL